jgi:hypothetical protein
VSHVPDIRSMEYPSMAYAVDPKGSGANYLLTPTKVQADSFISSSQLKAGAGGLMGLLALLPGKFLPAKLAANKALPFIRAGLGAGAGYMFFKAWSGMKELSRNMQEMVQDQILRRTFFGPYADPYQPRHGEHGAGGGHDDGDLGPIPRGVPRPPDMPRLDHH